MSHKVLDLVYKTHTQGKERAILMTAVIARHGKYDYYEDIQGTMSFFYKHIPLHFSREEVIINALLRNDLLKEEEASHMKTIMGEHDTLRAHFDHLQAMAAEIVKQGGQHKKDEFLRVVNEMLYTLTNHAEYEDKYLYPLAEMKIDDSLFSAVEKEMAEKGS